MPIVPDSSPLASDPDSDGGQTVAETTTSGHQQPLSFAFFALLTTASIILVALAVPVIFNGIVSVINDLGWDAPGFAEAGAITWYHLLSFQIAAVLLTVLMAGVAAVGAHILP